MAGNNTAVEVMRALMQTAYKHLRLISSKKDEKLVCVFLYGCVCVCLYWWMCVFMAYLRLLQLQVVLDFFFKCIHERI